MSASAPVSRLLRQALSLLLRQLIGPTDWDRVRAVVLQLRDAHLPGENKRQMAVADLRAAGLTLGAALLHLAIEAAVVWADRHEPG